MRRKYLLGAALALGLTASATAQVPPPKPPPTTPTTGGTAPKTPGTVPPGTPTTGGTTPGKTPTAPPGTPTTGGTAPPGTPTTGGTAPGATPTAPPGTPTTGGTRPGTLPTAPPGTPTTGGTVPGTAPPAPGSTAPPVTPVPGTAPGTAGTVVQSPFPTPLFQQAEVARSLSLTDRQNAELSRLTQTLQTQFATDFQGITRLPAADQLARRQQLERQFQQAFLTAARDILDAGQLNRFQQLQTQSGGFTSLADPVVQRQLGLTDAQIRALQASIDWSAAQLREINTVSLTDRERAVRLYADYQRAFQDRFNRFLTPEQQRSWSMLVGDPFAFQPYFPTGLPGVLAPGTTTTGSPPKN